MDKKSTLSASDAKNASSNLVESTAKDAFAEAEALKDIGKALKEEGHDEEDAKDVLKTMKASNEKREAE
tara:strand:+ start:111 stop:317 length:207 start_codon:yes stop_codon:yes gene_type:complete